MTERLCTLVLILITITAALLECADIYSAEVTQDTIIESTKDSDNTSETSNKSKTFGSLFNKLNKLVNQYFPVTVALFLVVILLFIIAVTLYVYRTKVRQLQTQLDLVEKAAQEDNYVEPYDGFGSIKHVNADEQFPPVYATLPRN